MALSLPDSYFIDIVNKTKKWDTWDAMRKDLNPYVADVYDRIRTLDCYILLDLYILELFVMPKAKVLFPTIADGYNDRQDNNAKAYADVVADIMKLHRNIDKLDAVLEAHTQLSDYVKGRIREDWEKQHAIETKGDDENLVVEDSTMEGYLKKLCDELVRIGADIEDTDLKSGYEFHFWFKIYHLGKLLWWQRIIYQASPDVREEHKKRVQGMMAEDKSCSSSQAKKCHASSEDNIFHQICLEYNT